MLPRADMKLPGAGSELLLNWFRADSELIPELGCPHSVIVLLQVFSFLFGSAFACHSQNTRAPLSCSLIRILPTFGVAICQQGSMLLILQVHAVTHAGHLQCCALINKNEFEMSTNKQTNKTKQSLAVPG